MGRSTDRWAGLWHRSWSAVTSDRGEQLVIRNPGRRFGYVAFAIFAVMFVFLLVDRRGNTVVCAVGLVVFVVLFALSTRQGVRCDQRGVTVTDEVGWRRRWSWSSIDHFEERGLSGIGAVETSGRWVRLTGYGTLGHLSAEKVTEMLEEQRRRFADGQSSPADGSG